MYYTYILQCDDNTRYFGSTNNLKKRIEEHERGRVSYTSKRKIKLVYFEEYATRSEAFRREMQFKNGRTRRETIEKLIRNFGQAKCQGFNSQTSLTLTKTENTA